MTVPMAAVSETRPVRSIGVFAVASIGIGSMVGAGIFALIGQAALVAGREVWASFLIGGVIAMLSGYSFAMLSKRYASAEGALASNEQATRPVAPSDDTVLLIRTIASSHAGSNATGRKS